MLFLFKVLKMKYKGMADFRPYPVVSFIHTAVDLSIKQTKADLTNKLIT